MLQKIPQSTNLRTLNVCGCVKLEHISELPCTIKKVDARYCFNFSRETSDMLWDQVKKERHGLEIVMPRTNIPEWFDYRCETGIPCLWVRGRFRNVALALEFQGVVGKKRRTRRQLVELHLVINGRCIPRKGYYNFRIEPNHVLVCDLQLLFNNEWLSIDTFFLEHEWNQVQISYEASSSTVALSEWGVFVYKQGTMNLEEHVQFMNPDPTRYSNIANTIVPTKDPVKDQIMLIEELALDEKYTGSLWECMHMDDEIVDKDHLAMLRELSKEVNDAMKGKPLDVTSGLGWILDTIKKTDVDDDDDAAYAGETSTSGHKGSLEAKVSDA